MFEELAASKKRGFCSVGAVSDRRVQQATVIRFLPKFPSDETG